VYFFAEKIKELNHKPISMYQLYCLMPHTSKIQKYDGVCPYMMQIAFMLKMATKLLTMINRIE